MHQSLCRRNVGHDIRRISLEVTMELSESLLRGWILSASCTSSWLVLQRHGPDETTQNQKSTLTSQEVPKQVLMGTKTRVREYFACALRSQSLAGHPHFKDAGCAGASNKINVMSHVGVSWRRRTWGRTVSSGHRHRTPGLALQVCTLHRAHHQPGCALPRHLALNGAGRH